MQAQEVGIESYPLRRRMLDAARGRKRQYAPFIYEARATWTIQLAGIGAQEIAVIDVDTDAPFLWLYTMGRASHDLLANFPDLDNWNATIDVRIGGAGGRSISNSPIPWMVMCPMRPQFHVMPAPQLIAPGSQFYCEITMLEVREVRPTEASIQFIGSKLYGWGK